MKLLWIAFAGLVCMSALIVNGDRYNDDDDDEDDNDEENEDDDEDYTFKIGLVDSHNFYAVYERKKNKFNSSIFNLQSCVSSSRPCRSRE